MQPVGWLPRVAGHTYWGSVHAEPMLCGSIWMRQCSHMKQTGEAGERRGGGFAAVRCDHDCGSLSALGCRGVKCPVLLCSLD